MIFVSEYTIRRILLAITLEIAEKYGNQEEFLKLVLNDFNKYNMLTDKIDNVH